MLYSKEPNKRTRSGLVLGEKQNFSDETKYKMRQ